MKRKKGRFLGMYLGTAGTSMLGSMLNGKGVMRAGKRDMRAEIGYNNVKNKQKSF